jgi:hypothetical protein
VGLEVSVFNCSSTDVGSWISGSSSLIYNITKEKKLEK